MGMIIMNGKGYTSMPKDGFPPIIYSDEEREVGVWRDGKPLYQKTINIGSLPNNSSKSVAHNIANLDRIVNSFGYAQNNDWCIPIPTVSRSTISSQVEIFVNSTIISIADGTDRSDYSGFITLQYTKTTDVPGSGKYTTYGGLTHHYSTNEQVVGTYTDGKTVYEKTYDTRISSGFYVLDNNISVDMLVSATGSIFDSDGLAYNFPYYYGNNQMARLIRDPSSLWTTNRGFVLHSAGFTYAKLIVRYTKYTSS